MGKRKERDLSSGSEDNEELRKRVRRLEKALRKEKGERGRSKHRSRKERCTSRSTSREVRSGRDYRYKRKYYTNRRSHSRDYYPHGHPYDEDAVDDYEGESRDTRNHSLSSSPSGGNLSSPESKEGETTQKALEKTPSEQPSGGTGSQGVVESDNVPKGEKELSAEIVKMFGERIMPDRTLAPPVHKDLAVRWEDIIKKGLPTEERKSLLKKLPPPENCTAIDPPKLNLEVKSALDNTIIKRDERIVEKQAKMTAAIAGIAKALNSTLEGDPENKLGLVEHLSDTARLLVDLQRDETMIRRSLIIKNVKSSYKDTLKDTLWDEELFGKGLAEKLKTTKVLQQSSKDLKSGAKDQSWNKNSKNSRGPSRWNRYKSHGQSKASGQRRTYNQRQNPSSQGHSTYRKPDQVPAKKD
ncbi:uncharacterized protein [Temnothorax longispinosus]|uniref:uncharacterized protein n=1 Tax=Temnothorax longispinosus TaxID=300112 RepID=UPI003A9956C2